MGDFFDDFNAVNQKAWISQIETDLKGKSIAETLHYTDDIEGINYKSHYHKEEIQSKDEDPGQLPYTRGANFKSNDWTLIHIQEEGNPKDMNKSILHALMNGATGLELNLFHFDKEACKTILKDIAFEYITTSIIYNTEEQKRFLENLIKSNEGYNGSIIGTSEVFTTESPKIRTHIVDGSQVQRAGGNNVQEVSYLLHNGHIVFHRLIEIGLSPDDAATKIKFKIGIGSNYFLEIAKIRSFRRLWSEIVNAYNPDHSCSCLAYVQAVTGSLNKSLKDPYTNLLRQTTEAMSAVVAGVDELLVLPYNWRAANPDLKRPQRLSKNIGLILKEESYLDKVIDPSGGSYSLESLTEEVIDKSWSLFQNLEKEGVSYLFPLVAETKQKRIDAIESKESTLIGVNKYLNEDKTNEQWQDPVKLTVGAELILERECQTIKA